jgi:cytochrome P450
MCLASVFKEMTILDSIDSTLYPSRFDLVFKSLWCYIPEPLLHYVRYLPFREYLRFRTFLDFSDSFSRGIISENKEKSDGKDMMSVLLRANASEDPNNKMTDSEVISQITCVIISLKMTNVVACSRLPRISTLLLAGHEPTANSLTWFLWEVAKHPQSQERIREEIAEFRRRRGEIPFSAVDLDNMTYTQAALKVMLCRFIKLASSDYRSFLLRSQ